MSATASLAWFAGHELRLAWRDWVALMSGGRKLKDRAILVGMGLFALALHALAYVLLKPVLAGEAATGKPALVMLSGLAVLSFAMMISQAMELVTRAFYSRDDLDLILSSPAPATDLFAVRITMMALTTATMSGLLLAPFLNVAALIGGPHWLAGYAVVLAIAFIATAVAVLVTLALFATLGARRTRLVAQITAAVMGAAFLIGIQVAAILSFGSMSRLDILSSQALIDAAPDAASLLYVPARAATGDATALALLAAAAAALFLAAATIGARRFAATVVTALGISDDAGAGRHADIATAFKTHATRVTLIAKEWRLLARDPWLVSQSLMQILYLIPPGLMLYLSFSDKAGQVAVLVPIVVMALGQLAGGLAWLTISGEDAPDLVATAPVRASALLWAKVEAVLILVAIIVAPLALAMAWLSPWGGFVTFAGALVAALCAVLIQLLFRAQSKRSNFRRRHVASRVSTFSEAFASILCAGTAALAAAGSPAAVVPAVLTLLVLAAAWMLAPKHA